MTDSQTKISTRQALVLLRAKIGVGVRAGKLDRVVRELTKEKRVAGGEQQEKWITPDDLDVLEGELRRMSAGWYQRRNVRGDFDALVSLDGGESYLCRLPYERVWNAETGQEGQETPEVVYCHEWPTARLTGRLRRSGGQDGKPVYAWEGAEGLSEADLLVAAGQWQTGSRKRAQ